MEKIYWTNSEIRKLFRMGERYKSIQTLYHAEEKGTIPQARRVARGKVQARNWTLQQLPEIGKKFGFLPNIGNQIVLCSYIPKGGVLKTTTSYYIARTMALNGMRTLIIGQDPELCITDVCLPRNEIDRLEDNTSTLGLFHFLVEGAEMEDIIQNTSLPTLDIIPETHDLVALDKWVNQQRKRETIYVERLMPFLQDYDVIVFDNGCGWNHLIENGICCADALLIPLGCNLLAYNASESNLQSIFEFREVMQISRQKLIMFATLLNSRSSLSQQIYAQYLTKYSSNLIPAPIRYTVKGEEPLIHKQTIFEYAPNSQVAEDYYELISKLWSISNDLNEILPNEVELAQIQQ